MTDPLHFCIIWIYQVLVMGLSNCESQGSVLQFTAPLQQYCMIPCQALYSLQWYAA